MNLTLELHAFATESQSRYLDAVLAAGSVRKASRKLGVHHKTIQDGMKRLQSKAVLQNYAPGIQQTMTLPEPLQLVKTTIQINNRTGEVERTWLRASPAEDARAAAIEAAYVAAAEELPRHPKTAPPLAVEKELCNLYTYTDFHLGMLASASEGGADWNMGIAEDLLTRSFAQMLRLSPAAHTCVVSQLGDFLHSDGLLPVTPSSGHVLDQAARFHEMVAASIRLLRQIINAALTKHQKVIVVMAEGNHDLASSVWLREIFKALYEAEPRVSIVDSAIPYYVYCHGETLLGFHHGHIRKNDQLPLLFAAQYPVEWGATKKRFCHTGHRHHEEMKEHAGMKVVQHPTLSSRDAYAARGGWLSERQATCYTYHKKFGQVGSVTIMPEMFS